MPVPEFALRNVFKMLELWHETKDTALGLSGDSNRADSEESTSLSRDRITSWASASGRCLGKDQLTQSLDGSQVSAELDSIFRETPSFGRSLARRLQDFHSRDTKGPWKLIGGGGEAVVFFDEETQEVIKLFSPLGKARFGWEVGTDLEGNREIIPGSLATALIRYARAEQMFPSGLEIHMLGEEASFLLMRQPFILGENPLKEELSTWMKALGWLPFNPQTESRMLSHLTWRKDGLIATDVRPENVIRSCEDGALYSIDFVMATL